MAHKMTEILSKSSKGSRNLEQKIPGIIHTTFSNENTQYFKIKNSENACPPLSFATFEIVFIREMGTFLRDIFTHTVIKGGPQFPKELKILAWESKHFFKISFEILN